MEQKEKFQQLYQLSHGAARSWDSHCSNLTAAEQELIVSNTKQCNVLFANKLYQHKGCYLLHEMVYMTKLFVLN